MYKIYTTQFTYYVCVSKELIYNKHNIQSIHNTVYLLCVRIKGIDTQYTYTMYKVYTTQPPTMSAYQKSTYYVYVSKGMIHNIHNTLHTAQSTYYVCMCAYQSLPTMSAYQKFSYFVCYVSKGMIVCGAAAQIKHLHLIWPQSRY